MHECRCKQEKKGHKCKDQSRDGRCDQSEVKVSLLPGRSHITDPEKEITTGRALMVVFLGHLHFIVVRFHSDSLIWFQVCSCLCDIVSEPLESDTERKKQVNILIATANEVIRLRF